MNRSDHHARVMEKNANWRGGRYVASNGYVLVRTTGRREDPYHGYVYEHRLVAERMLGRTLLPGELVHHVNGDKTDNREENITVLPSIAHHLAAHRTRGDLRSPGQENPVVFCACGCGESFRWFDGAGRPRKYVSGHNLRRRHAA